MARHNRTDESLSQPRLAPKNPGANLGHRAVLELYLRAKGRVAQTLAKDENVPAIPSVGSKRITP